MGAFGAALIAQEEAKENSTLMTLEELENFHYTTNLTRCGICTNRCLLTIHKFESGENFISGNRCDNPVAKMKKIKLQICLNTNTTDYLVTLH